MLPYMLNFDLKKVAELNKKGLSKFESDKANRTSRIDKATCEDIKKKIKKEKIDRLVIDSDDILILRFIYTIGDSSKSVRDTEDKDFFWVKYDALFAEYENLLLIDKSALNTRLNKYVKMNLIERKCVKNEDGSFSFFKITGLSDLVYVPVDSSGKKPVEGQVHFSEVEEVEAEEDLNINTGKPYTNKEKMDLIKPMLKGLADRNLILLIQRVHSDILIETNMAITEELGIETKVSSKFIFNRIKNILGEV